MIRSKALMSALVPAVCLLGVAALRCDRESPPDAVSEAPSAVTGVTSCATAADGTITLKGTFSALTSGSSVSDELTTSDVHLWVRIGSSGALPPSGDGTVALTGHVATNATLANFGTILGALQPSSTGSFTTDGSGVIHQGTVTPSEGTVPTTLPYVPVRVVAPTTVSFDSNFQATAHLDATTWTYTFPPNGAQATVATYASDGTETDKSFPAKIACISDPVFALAVTIQ